MNSPLRIAHIVQDLDPAMGGLATVPVNIARRQARLGHAVEIWTSASHGVESEEGLTVVERPGSNGVLERAFARRFEPDLGRVDLVHTHTLWRPYTAWLTFAARRRGLPAFHTMHGMMMDWPMRQKTPKKKLYLRAVGARLLRAFTAVHLLNSQESAETARVGADFRYFELPNGVDPAEFEALPPLGRFRAAHPELKDRTIVASLGRLHPVKGPELLLGAFLDLSERHPDAALVLAGPDEGMQSQLESMVADHPARDRVVMPGLVQGEMRLALLADTDLFVQASRHETMSMSILEAAFAGLCIVVTDRCNAPEIAESSAGRVVPTSREGIAVALDELLGNADERALCGQRARAMIEERFLIDRIIEQLVEHYRHALGGGTFPWLLSDR